MDDHSLARDASDNDQGEAFVRLLLEHEPSVRAFLRGLLPTWNDVDEVVQEASLVAWRKFADFEEGTAFGGWFLTIARFEALKHRQRVARSPLVFADDVWERLDCEAADETSSPRYQHYLEDCLAKLDPASRDVLLQTHAPGMVIRKLAAESGRNEQAFYKMIQRLRSQVFACISKSLTAENS